MDILPDTTKKVPTKELLGERKVSNCGMELFDLLWCHQKQMREAQNKTTYKSIIQGECKS